MKALNFKSDEILEIQVLKLYFANKILNNLKLNVSIVLIFTENKVIKISQVQYFEADFSRFDFGNALLLSQNFSVMLGCLPGLNS